MNNYVMFLKENGFTKKFVEKATIIRIDNKTDDINETIDYIHKLNNYLQNKFLNMKLCNVKIYEFPIPEESIEEDEPLLFSFKELYIKDLIALLYNRKIFLKDSQQLPDGQDRIIYKFIESIENQSKDIKLAIIDKFDKDYKDLITSIYITFTIEK